MSQSVRITCRIAQLTRKHLALVLGQVATFFDTTIHGCAKESAPSRVAVCGCGVRCLWR